MITELKENQYFVFGTEVGCGLAGFKPEDIAPFFEGYTKNVKLPQSFLDILVNE